MNMIPSCIEFQIVSAQHDAHIRKWARHEALCLLHDAAGGRYRAQLARGWKRVINKQAARYCVERARELRLMNG